MNRHKQRHWRLWSGCCMPFVLWHPDGDATSIEAAPVSGELKLELMQWHVHAMDHVGQDGWDSPEAQELDTRRGRGLQKWLERELDQQVDLDLSAACVGW